MKKILILFFAFFLIAGCTKITTLPDNDQFLSKDNGAVQNEPPKIVLEKYEQLVSTYGEIASLSVCPEEYYLIEGNTDTKYFTYYYNKNGELLVSSDNLPESMLDEEPVRSLIKGCVLLKGKELKKITVIGTSTDIEEKTPSNETNRRLLGSGRRLTIPSSSTPQRFLQPCYDSDGGINFNTQGSTYYSTNPIPKTDRCIGNLVIEYYCQNNKKISSLIQSCSEGCTNGACDRSVSSEPVCTDSDRGRNYEEQGTTSSTEGGESNVQTDSCFNEGLLREYYCQSSGRTGLDFHTCEYGCTDGICNPEPEAPTLLSCEDSDGGMDYDTEGTVTQTYSEGPGIVRRDSCIGTFVQELFCRSDNTAGQQLHNCEYGCTDGACTPEPEEEPVCNDSDGGRDYDERGTTTRTMGDETETHTDTCLGNSVREYYCQASSSIGSVLHTCAYGCTAGVCNEEPEPTCTDSDGGATYNERGTVTRIDGDETQTNTDYCVSNSVREYYCLSNNIRSVSRSCVYGCTEGACNSEPDPPEPDSSTGSVTTFNSATGQKKLLIVNDLGTTDIYTNIIINVRIAQTETLLSDTSTEVLESDTCINVVAGETFHVLSPDESKREIDPSTLTDPDTILGSIPDDSYRYFTLPETLTVPYHVRVLYGEWRYDTGLSCYKPAYLLVDSCDGRSVYYKSSDLHVFSQDDGQVIAIKMSGFIPEGNLYGSEFC